MTRRDAIRAAPWLLALAAGAGCDGGPDRTPTAPPVEYDEPASADAKGPIPTAPEPRRIETH